ncbi:N-acetylglucosamine-6-phosphate deacetylase [Candidatus Latescibacterota bacterium]
MKNKRTVLTNGTVVFPDGVMQDGVVVIENAVITELAHKDDFKPLESDYVIDCENNYVCPGFIDIHNQGGNGFSVMDGSEESIFGMCRAHAAHGTTGLLLTPVIEKRGYRSVLPKLAGFTGKDTGGASILGIHAEGPFTNPAKSGFMPKSGIVHPDAALLDDILELGGGKIVEMTIAPELPGALDIINTLARNGIVVSLGHSNATLNEVFKAIDYGASHVTHFFNTMSPIHHREPGLAGAALYSTDLTVEIIMDGFHLHPWIVGLILQNKSAMLTCLVTDAMSVTGLADGEYEELGQKVVLKDGHIVLANDSSTLAGSVLTMDRAVGNMMNMLGISIVDAVTMASTTPSTVLGLENRKGRIEVGFDADIVVLGRTYETEMTLLQGEIIYEKK